jgi:hypothetical protein
VITHLWNEMVQHRHHSQIDDILQHRSQSAYDSESDDFAQLLPSGIIHIINLVLDIHCFIFYGMQKYAFFLFLANILSTKY